MGTFESLHLARKAFNLFLEEEEEEETKGVLFIGNSLIHYYAECGDLDYARMLFDQMLERTSLICGYGKRNMPKAADSLFFEMVATGIKPNSATMVCVISACAKLKDVALSERVCTYIIALGSLE